MPSEVAFTETRVAVLVTCHNRVAVTLRGLKCLFALDCLPEVSFKVYLVDDGSTDGTAEAVRRNFPQVRIIQGTGQLYWAGGMRRAWDLASSEEDFDFYLWFNDDVCLHQSALKVILRDYFELLACGRPTIMVGAFTDPDTGEMTYSGSINSQKLRPNGSPQFCNNITGNFVLVPEIIFQTVGGLNEAYTHGIADMEYALRVIRAGFDCRLVSEVIGTCKIGEKRPWCDPSYRLYERWENAWKVTHGNLPEYFYFVKINFGLWRSVCAIAKALICLLCPRAFYR